MFPCLFILTQQKALGFFLNNFTYIKKTISIFFRSSFDRPNIDFEVIKKTGGKNRNNQLKEILDEQRFKNKSGIIYCLSCNEVDEIHEYLYNQGIIYVYNDPHQIDD